MLKSKYLSRSTLSELYKLYVRPHLDCGDVNYHVPQRDDCTGNYLMEKLESVLYSAALAVTGTWRGTSRERLYDELGWKSLSSRRWSRRNAKLLSTFLHILESGRRTDALPKNFSARCRVDIQQFTDLGNFLCQ